MMTMVSYNDNNRWLAWWKDFTDLRSFSFLPCTFEIAVYDVLTMCGVTFQVPYIESEA